MGLCVNENVTAGYCGRNGGLQYGGLSWGRAWMRWSCQVPLWRRDGWKWWKF